MFQLHLIAFLEADSLLCIVPTFLQYQFRPSFMTTSQSTVKMVRDRSMVSGYYGEPICSHDRDTQGTHLQPLTTTPSPSWGSHPQSKLALQIADKWCQIITLPNSTIASPRTNPFQKGVVKKLHSKLLKNHNRYLRALYTRPVGTH